jgi:flagellar motor switch protein FliG
MIRRNFLPQLLALSLGALGTAAWAAVPPPPGAPDQRPDVLVAGASMTELGYERMLEDSIRQSLAAFLGPEPFMLTVRVGLRYPLPPAAAAPAIQDDPDAWLDEAEEPPPLPGLPGLRAQEPPRLPRRPRAAAATAPAQSGLAMPVVERIRIALVLPTTVREQDEDTIRNLIHEKAALDLGRGDALEISRREFPRAAIAAGTPGGTFPAAPAQPGMLPPAPGPVPGPDGGLPPWAWGLLGALGTATVGMGMALLSRRDTPYPAAQNPALAPQAQAPAALEARVPQMALVPQAVAPRETQDWAGRQELMVLLLEHPDLGEKHLVRLMGSEGGMSRAAALVRGIGLPVARRLFTGVPASDWTALELAGIDQRHGESPDVREVLDEALIALMRERSERRSVDRTSPFAFLATLDDSQLQYILEDEGPRVQALVLSQLAPERAVGILRLRSVGEQGAIAAAMGELHLLPKASFLDLAHHLSEKAALAPKLESALTDGLGLLVNLLDHSDRATEQGILSGLSSQNPRLLAEVRELYLTFDDLARVPREVLKDALREVDKQHLAEALREAPTSVQEAVKDGLTERARRIVEETLAVPPAPTTDGAEIEGIRRDLVQRVRKLLSLGRFSMQDLAPVAEDFR